MSKSATTVVRLDAALVERAQAVAGGKIGPAVNSLLTLALDTDERIGRLEAAVARLEEIRAGDVARIGAVEGWIAGSGGVR